MKSGGRDRPSQSKKSQSRRPSQSKKNQKIEKRAVPKSEMGMNVDKTVNYTTLHELNQKVVNIKFSKSFQETPPREQAKLFIEKCKQCSIICDFSSPSIDQKSKATKAQLLKHIASGFTIPNLLRTISQEAMNIFYKMLSINLFRPMPKMARFTVVETHDVLYDSAWPHLTLLYDALQSSLNCKFAQNISPEFIYHLIGNSVSPDDRERIAVRDILHSLYTKFMNQRAIVREKISEQFINGICSSELLEFFVCVASGFNSPLNPEHISFFCDSILPLHKLNDFPVFFIQLKKLINTYIQKSGFLLDSTIDYLLMHWPKSNRLKQGLFLKEIEELFVSYEIHISTPSAIKVFKMIGEMANNMNSDVAEIAVDICTNPKLSFTLKTHAQSVFPLIVGPLYASTQNHWDDCIRANAFVTLQTLSEIDKSVFNQQNEYLKSKAAQKITDFNNLKSNWKKISDMAKANNRSIKPIDFTDLKEDYDYNEAKKI